jgi:GntR family transcriptional regulator
VTDRALYRSLAADLRAAITRGDFPIGAQLPTEHELCATYSVSRFTAREALRLLSEDGLIARRRGAGTVVVAATARTQFSQTIGDLGDLLQYARDARLDVRGVIPLGEGAGEVARLDLDIASAWTRIEGLRRRTGENAPIAFTRIYVRSDICPPSADIMSWDGALNELIAQRSGVVSVRIVQTITAVALSRLEAKMLDAQANAPALRTVRRYLDAAGNAFQASVSLHPGDRFSYAMDVVRNA